VQDLWLSARAAWPGVEVGQEAFARYVAERAAEAGVAGAGDLAATDLYLACACAAGAPMALATFERVLLAQVPVMIASVDPAGSIGDEVRQRLSERLFVGDGVAPPRIAAYTGRGSLLGWLRVAAVRIAIDMLRARDAEREVPLEAALDDAKAVGSGGDVALELIKERYREEFEEAVRAAVRGLPLRQRNLLRLHLCGGVTTRKLAAMYQVNQSTAARWVADAREQVRVETRARLSERLRLSAAEIDSLAGVLLSRLDISLTGCLAA